MVPVKPISIMVLALLKMVKFQPGYLLDSNAMVAAEVRAAGNPESKR
jgi:hypothetical protein